MSDFLDDLIEPKEPEPGPGQQLAQLLAREGKLDALLSVIRAEQDFHEMLLRKLLRTRPLNDPAAQSDAVLLQGRLSAYASLLGKLRGWGVSPRKVA